MSHFYLTVMNTICDGLIFHLKTPRLEVIADSLIEQHWALARRMLPDRPLNVGKIQLDQSKVVMIVVVVVVVIHFLSLIATRTFKFISAIPMKWRSFL